MLVPQDAVIAAPLMRAIMRPTIRAFAFLILATFMTFGYADDKAEDVFDIPRIAPGIEGLRDIIDSRHLSYGTRIEKFGSVDSQEFYLLAINVGSGMDIFENHVYECNTTCHRLLMFNSGYSPVKAFLHYDRNSIELAKLNGTVVLTANFIELQ